MGDSESSLTKVVKLKGDNYHEWKVDVKMLLILKKLWGQMNEDRPPRENVEALTKWQDIQQQALAVIHLCCERDQARLIVDSETGIAAWSTLAETYASSDITNVMRVEELFGRARKTANQSMGQWISHVRGLATQLQEVGVDTSADRIANRILAGLGKEYQGVKIALRSRGRLTVDMVTQHLLNAEMDMEDDVVPTVVTAPATTTIVNTGGVQSVSSGY